MALNNINFILGQGGLGRPLTGLDHVSGLIYYSATLPSGFTSSNRIKQMFSVADAETAGILGDYNDATAATGTYLVTTLGGVTDSIKITVAEPFSAITTLCNYTKVAGDTTIALMGASIAAAINSGTLSHGYTASFTTATLTITAPKKFGIFLNSGTPIVVTITGTIAGTLTQFTGGVCSKQAIWHYHIAEYFRLQPQGNLYVGFFAIPSPYTFTEITTMQNFSGGNIRQIGIYKDASAFASGDLTTIDAVNKALVAGHKEIIAIYGADISGTADVSTLTDLSTLTANTVSAVIGQDGAGLGAFLYLTYGKSITILGATLGAIALAKVNESIAWIQKFNISNGFECDTLAFGNGVLFTAATVTDSYLSTLQNMRYIFLRKFVGIAGSYFNENPTAITSSSNYAFIADNRTIQKATRGVYAGLLPALNSPIVLNSDGTLTDQSAAYFVGLAEVNLIQMVRNTELSAQKVVINPTQNVLSTGILVVSISLVPTGTARNITVNIGFNVSIAGK